MVVGHGLQECDLHARRLRERRDREALVRQDELVQAGVIVAVGRGIERAVCRAGQRHEAQAGGHRDGADHLQCAHKRVDGVQAVLRAQDVQLAVCVVVGHIERIARQAERFDVCLVLQIVQRSDAEAGAAVDRKDMILDAVGGIDRALRHGLGSVHRTGLEGDPRGIVGVVGIEAVRIDLLFLAAVELDLIACHVAGIVDGNDADLGAGDVGGIDRDRGFHAELGLINSLTGKDLRLAGIRHEDGRHIAVVLCGDPQTGFAGYEIAGVARAGQLRSGVIDRELRRPGSARAERALHGLRGAVPVVFRDGIHSDLDLRALGQRTAVPVRHIPAQRDGDHVVAPGRCARVVVSAELHALINACIDLAGLRIGDDGIQITARVADQAGVCAIELHAGRGADGRAVGEEFRSLTVGVRRKVVGRGGAGAAQDERVGVLRRGVADGIRIDAVAQGDVLIEHGGIRPAAVVGQDRQRQLGLGFRRIGGVDKALDIAAIRIVFCEVSTVGLAELHRCLDGDGAAGGDRHGSGVDVRALRLIVQTGQIELGIRRSESAVAVEVVLGGIGLGQRVMRAVCDLQEHERIAFVDGAVAVQVIEVAHAALDVEGDLRAQDAGRIGHVVLTLDLLDRHGVDAGMEHIGKSLV